MPEIIILGGPNGAGKTSAAKHIFQEKIGTRQFVNADEIARGLSPFDPESASVAAGRLLLNRMHDLVRAGESFVVETTCAGTSNLNFVRQRKADGWRVVLLFLWLPTAKAAIERVARRVRQGGHSVPADVIARRHAAGTKNVRRHYLPLADLAAIHDNSDDNHALIAEKVVTGDIVVHDERRWLKFLESST